MAQLHDLRDVFHGDIALVGRPNCFVAFFPQLLCLALKLALAAGVGLRKGFQARLGLRRFSFWPSDSKMVGLIPASRLA